MSAIESAPPHQRIGHYRVLRQIGEGGMGVVYEAVREDIGTRAAIKVLRSEYAGNNEIAARFFNEARAANMIQHLGIVKVFDYGHLPTGEAYLAMEFIEGVSLRKRLETEVRLNEADSMRIARQIAAALASAHAKTIVHRDLKPENVMLVPDAETPGGERVKILDFGIAKLDASAQGSVRTRTYSMMGTPIYMAPEQCRGIKQIDDRADVYALGVMIYEMIAGQPPFLAEAPGDLIGMHMFKPPPTLRTAVPHVDGQLDSLVDSMLNKEPARRPSMSEVALLLKQLGNFVSNVLPMRVLSNPEISGRLRVPSLEQVRNASPTTEPANTAGTEQVSTSSRFRPLGDASRAQQGSTTADHGESERERALAPTMKAPVLRLDGADAAGRKPAHPVNVRISAKAAEHAKAATEPMDIVSLATPPAPRSEEPTAVMASSGIDAIAAAAIRAEYVEAPTAPVMNRANVQSAQDAYLRAKAASVAAASTEPATVPRMQGVTARHLASERGLFERAQVELGKRWANPEQRLGILVFGGLVVIGALLVLLVLVQGGQGN